MSFTKTYVHVSLLPQIWSRFLAGSFQDEHLQEFLAALQVDSGNKRRRRNVAVPEVPAASSVQGANVVVAVVAAAASDDGVLVPYSTCNLEELREIAKRRDEQISDLKAENRSLKKNVARLSDRCSHLVSVAAEADAQTLALAQAINYRPGRNITVHGGYNLALIRNKSHVGTSAVALMVGESEMHGKLTYETRQSVIVFEHRAAVAKQVRSRTFYRQVDSYSNTGAGDSGNSVSGFEVHLFKGDATKQDMVDKHKLHVSTCTSLFVTEDRRRLT